MTGELVHAPLQLLRQRAIRGDQLQPAIDAGHGTDGDEAPPGAPWVGFVRGALARVSNTPLAVAEPGPNAGDIAAAAAMSDDQRHDMVSGMVARLADRLRADGTDVDGWLRLVQAYVVLGERAKAKDAAADAKRALAQRPDDIKRIDDLVKGLGLEG